MTLLVHPFGNANVRAVLRALEKKQRLAKFLTTLGWPGRIGRRGYNLPREKIRAYPMRELVRLLSGRLGFAGLTRHERGWASVDRIWQRLDEKAARYLCAHKRQLSIDAVYAYEDCALHIFEAAQDLRVRRIYDLPIAYWETSQRLLREEAERYPNWEPTLSATRDSPEKLARKTRELELAELVICPSNFVLESLPAQIRATRGCVMTPFGSPNGTDRSYTTHRSHLRVLFAGALTQRKGLADLFAAMKLVRTREVELVVMGSLLQPLAWYRERCPHFIYEPPRPHREVLALMRTCDLFILPSIVEGRALVQQEAMASGLPLLATRNAGADDLIEDGVTGFLLPIRSPEAIAEKIDWCAAHREQVSGMGIAAQKRAAARTWRGYGEQVLAAIESLTGE